MELAKTVSTNLSSQPDEGSKVSLTSCRNMATHNTRRNCLLREPCRNLMARFINQMVASAFGFSPDRLLKGDRGNAKVTRARHISIYLMHTCLSFSLTEIGKIYSKDRTTIGHACRVIEDLRDEPAFDDRILELEQTIQTVLLLAGNNFVRGVGN